MKYNYHDQVELVRKNPRHELPEDVNHPVEKFLSGIGCDLGIEELEKFRKSVGYGEIELVHNDVPDAKLSIPVNCGMASEGLRKSTVVKKGKWTAYIYRTVKNSNITKKRMAKNGSDENNGSN